MGAFSKFQELFSKTYEIKEGACDKVHSIDMTIFNIIAIVPDLKNAFAFLDTNKGKLQAELVLFGLYTVLTTLCRTQKYLSDKKEMEDAERKRKMLKLRVRSRKGKWRIRLPLEINLRRMNMLRLRSRKEKKEDEAVVKGKSEKKEVDDAAAKDESEKKGVDAAAINDESKKND